MIDATKKRYVIETVEADKQTAGGIYVGNTDESQFGRIISVGPEIENPLTIGTQVIVNWQTAFPVKFNGRRVFIVESDNILGVFNNG